MENTVLPISFIPSTETSDERIKKEVTTASVVVDKVYKADYQKENTLTAQLKQTVKTVSLYPTKSVSNNMQDNIFSDDAFGFKKTPYENNEVRVAWINVPMKSTVDSVAAQLEKFPNATLYKVLSNKPILTDDQKYAVENNITTVDVIGARQAVRYSDNIEEVEKRGKLIPDANGKIQYRAIFFSQTKKEDMDLRTSAPEDFYASASLTEEINALGQTVL